MADDWEVYKVARPVQMIGMPSAYKWAVAKNGNFKDAFKSKEEAEKYVAKQTPSKTENSTMKTMRLAGMVKEVSSHDDDGAEAFFKEANELLESIDAHLRSIQNHKSAIRRTVDRTTESKAKETLRVLDEVDKSLGEAHKLVRRHLL